MPRFPKFAILEIDGEELGIGSEYEPVSEDIYYDNGKTETVKEKIDTINLGRVFFQYVLSSDLEIPGNRSLMVADKIDASNYNIDLDGTAILGVF